jgi:hypothetical protein
MYNFSVYNSDCYIVGIQYIIDETEKEGQKERKEGEREKGWEKARKKRR